MAGAQPGLGVVGGQLRHQRAVLVLDAGRIAQEDELLRLQRHGHGFRHLLHAEVEHLAGGRIAVGLHQHDVAVGQGVLQRLRVYAAHRAGVHVIHAIHHAHRLGGEEVAGSHLDGALRHGGVGQALGEQRLDVDALGAVGALHAFQCLQVGDAQAAVIDRREAARRQFVLDLRPRAGHQHELDAQRRQQVAVVHQRGHGRALHHLTAEGHDEGLAAEEWM